MWQVNMPQLLAEFLCLQFIVFKGCNLVWNAKKKKRKRKSRTKTSLFDLGEWLWLVQGSVVIDHAISQLIARLLSGL